MYKGKSTCQQLKKIRREIAEANHIPWEDSECHYEGDCAGTCPKCDAELRFLENALRKGQQLGKAVALSGAALAFSACGNQTPVEMPFDDTVDSADVMMQNDSVDTDTIKIVPSPNDIDAVCGFIESEIESAEVESAEFKGGQNALDKYLEEHLVYPEKAKKEAISGRVFVSFVVEKDGSLSDIQVERGGHPLLDSEAVHVVREMPKWEPGKNKNTDKPAKGRFVLPIDFKLD
ncbi:MAG: energy transducer TonB [Bacteroidales bacterium]|nr:energy transducer TonB [Bacteroidales bacterium]